MDKTNRPSFPVDSVSILFLSLIRKEHTNSFRFSMTLREPVDPEVLQTAVDRLWHRMPSVMACIRPGFFHYTLVQSEAPPVVRKDPGLLKTMPAEELHSCAFRVFYEENTISIEAFHALTDGHGAITALTTLVSEYLKLKEGIAVPVSHLRLDADEAPTREETEDPALALADAKPWHLPSRFSYVPPSPADTDWRTRAVSRTWETKQLLEAAHRNGVTLNTLLTALMARALMKQQLAREKKKYLPVRIMVPANLRPLFGKRTLRNFSLYSLPTMEVADRELSLQELCRSFENQIRANFTKEKLASMSSYNVRTQNAWYFRCLPWAVKGAAMRLGYRFFGESNSSLTLTNLGRVVLPEELQPHVTDMQVYMTPRATSPYGCTILSFGDKLTVNISKFTNDRELEELFFGELQAAMDV